MLITLKEAKFSSFNLAKSRLYDCNEVPKVRITNGTIVTRFFSKHTTLAVTTRIANQAKNMSKYCTMFFYKVIKKS